MVTPQWGLISSVTPVLPSAVLTGQLTNHAGERVRPTLGSTPSLPGRCHSTRPKRTPHPAPSSPRVSRPPLSCGHLPAGPPSTRSAPAGDSPDHLLLSVLARAAWGPRGCMFAPPSH